MAAEVEKQAREIALQDQLRRHREHDLFMRDLEERAAQLALERHTQAQVAMEHRAMMAQASAVATPRPVQAQIAALHRTLSGHSATLNVAGYSPSVSPTRAVRPESTPASLRSLQQMSAASREAILESRRAAALYHPARYGGYARIPPSVSSALLLRGAYTRDYIRNLGVETF